MESVTVLDSPCGEGKTTWCIDYMKKNIGNDKFIYVTPFIDEITRVRNEINGVGDNKDLKLYEPNLINSTKYNDFVRLLGEQRNIAMTHSLFSMSGEDVVKYIENGEYTLILDEVMDVVTQIPVKKGDISVMIDAKLIKIEENGLITWIDDYRDSKYDDFKIRCLNHSVYYVNNTVIFWTFPAQIFKSFKKVIISTYMYDCQIQRYYYDFFNIKYDKVSVEDGKIIPYKFKKIDIDKIHICDNNKVNYIGDSDSALSKSWYKNKGSMKPSMLKKSLYNTIYNIYKAKAKDVIWTSFKDYKKSVQSKGYVNCFVPCNARATNSYGDKHYIGYAINKYINPYVIALFKSRGITMDDDNYALSEMIQFICRSAIRNHEDIYIYVPSKRMRNLLKEYCNQM